MLCEIGSDFWELPSNDERREFQLEGISCHGKIDYFISGRSAIRALCRQLEYLEKRILIPAYTCETVIAPFEKEGWNILYYEIEKNLSIDKKDLMEKIVLFRPGVVLFHNYFGFRTIDEIEPIVEYCRENNIVVVEDITQNLFSEYQKIQADYYIGSLRKFLAIAEGGLLISQGSEMPIYLKNEAIPQVIGDAQLAFFLKEKYMRGQNVCKDDFMEAYHNWKENFVNYDDIYDINKQTLVVLERIDIKKLKQQRKDNFLLLYRELRQVKGIKVVLNEPKEKETPLYFPIYVENKNRRKEIQQFLAKEQIYCPIIWPQYISDEHLGTDTKYIYDHIMCIPCDQRYQKDEMNKIIKTVRKIVEDY